jgi:hypothetical protein
MLELIPFYEWKEVLGRDGEVVEKFLGRMDRTSVEQEKQWQKKRSGCVVVKARPESYYELVYGLP